MRDWAPFLPELPEHRRLGYRPPRDIDSVVVVTGEDAPPPRGFMAWMQAKSKEAEAQQRAKMAASSGKSGGGSPGAASKPSAKNGRPVVKPTAEPLDEDAAPAKPAGKPPRPVKKASTKSGGSGAAR
jgi:hypothetical protein